MNARTLATVVLALWLPLYAVPSAALTMKQVSSMCHSALGECSDHPIVQAYVGGALDLLATLDERTSYLGEVYCKEAKDLFDVPTIIRFMQERSDQFATDNAMLVLVRYFEEHGGCKR